MGKISNTTQYPPVTPVADDYVIGTQDGVGTPTKNFLMSAISAFINGSHGLQEVCDVNQITTTGMTVGGVSTLGEIDSAGPADIADTLYLSKATGNGLDVTADVLIGGDVDANGRLSVAELVHAELAVGTGLQVDANATIDGLLSLTKATGTGLIVTAGSTLNGSLDCYGLHHQWGALTVEGITTLNNALDANSTADIADTLTLSKATGTGLSVTANATIGGRLTAGTSVVDQAYVAADAFQTNNSSFTATSSAVQTSFGTTFTTFDATIVSCKITGSAPASATAAGTTGTIVTDADYIYVCTATDTWKRVAIATW